MSVTCLQFYELGLSVSVACLRFLKMPLSVSVACLCFFKMAFSVSVTCLCYEILPMSVSVACLRSKKYSCRCMRLKRVLYVSALSKILNSSIFRKNIRSLIRTPYIRSW